MKTIKSIIILVLMLFGLNTRASNYVQNNDSTGIWGYFLQIIDENYIPKIATKNSTGYITLQSGIAPYDSVFAKYKITDFYQYAPTAASDWLRQIYALVCDSGQTQLGVELSEKFNVAIPFVEIFNSKTELTALSELKTKHIFIQKGDVLFFGNDDMSEKTIRFFDLSGKLLFSKNTSDNSLNPSTLMQMRGIYLYDIKIGNERIVGKYCKLMK